MAVPLLKLDLAPPSNLWHMHHAPLSWSALAAGGLLLAASLGFTWRAYSGAALAGRRTVTLVARTSQSAQAEREVLTELRNVDVGKELPRWRLAEKIFTERSLPWSRLTAELERSLVPDVRLKSIQRTRSTDMKVQLKLKGEARTRPAEAAFMEALHKNTFFEQVFLEREGERQGGGVDFEYTLAAQSSPPPFVPLPKQPKYATAKPGQPLPKPGPVGVPKPSSKPSPMPGPLPGSKAGPASAPKPLLPRPAAGPLRPSPAVPAPAPGINPFAPPPSNPATPPNSQGRPVRRNLEPPEGSRPRTLNGQPAPLEGQS